MSAAEPMTDRERWVALVVLCTGMLMIVLDGTIVNVALPTIKDELGFSDSSLAWVVNAYLIPFGGLLLLAGRLGDLAGRRLMFLAGLAVFTAASVLCGVAQNEWMLVGARFLQGAGGAFTSAVILGVIITMFPDRNEQAKAIGVYAFVASAGGSIGLLLGGVIVDTLSWHWIFLVNVPIGIATAMMALRVLPADKGLGFDQGTDIPGAVLITSSLMSGVYAIVTAADHGWGSWQVIVFGTLSVLLMTGFIQQEKRAASPLMPLRIFKSRNVAGANLVQLLMVTGFFGLFFLGALYLQRVLDYSPFQVGLAFLPMTVVFGSLSLGVSARLQARFGSKPLLPPGLALAALSLGLLTGIGTDSNYFTEVMPSMILLGLGAGIAAPAITQIAMSGSTPEDAGLTSGLVNTTMQAGGAVGLAVLATLSATRSDNKEAEGASLNDALVSGYRLAFLIAALLIVASIVVSLFLEKESEAEAAPAPDGAEAEAPEPAVFVSH